MIFNDLRKLHEAIYHCQACIEKGYPVTNIQPLWDPERGRTHTQKWGMLIGQAPGKTEMEHGLALRLAFEKISSPNENISKHRNEQQGIAFVGPSGKRLKKWLQKAGLPEADLKKDFLKTSIVKCYPGEVKSKKSDRKGDRAPSSTEINLCRNFLLEQIRLLQPQVLIPMGRLAIQWFFPDKGLKETVGKELSWRGIRVICLPHPSPGSPWENLDNNKELLVEALTLLSKVVEVKR